MNRKLSMCAVLGVTIISLFLFAGQGETALINGGFESEIGSTITGWTNTYGSNANVVTNLSGYTLAAHEGSNFLAITPIGFTTDKSVSQAVYLSAGQALQGWFAALGGAFNLSLVISGPNAYTFTAIAPTSSWTQWLSTPVVTAGTYTVTLLALGNTGYGAHDAVSVVPIPATVWLLGAGLVGLVGLRRKFRK